MALLRERLGKLLLKRFLGQRRPYLLLQHNLVSGRALLVLWKQASNKTPPLGVLQRSTSQARRIIQKDLKASSKEELFSQVTRIREELFSDSR